MYFKVATNRIPAAFSTYFAHSACNKDCLFLQPPMHQIVLTRVISSSMFSSVFILYSDTYACNFGYRSLTVFVFLKRQNGKHRHFLNSKKTLKNNECFPPRYFGRSKLCVEYPTTYLFDLKVVY